MPGKGRCWLPGVLEVGNPVRCTRLPHRPWIRRQSRSGLCSINVISIPKYKRESRLWGLGRYLTTRRRPQLPQSALCSGRAPLRAAGPRLSRGERCSDPWLRAGGLGCRVRVTLITLLSAAARGGRSRGKLEPRALPSGGNAAVPLGRGPESSDSGSSFTGAAAMSALAKASGVLKSVDYEVFGRVQGKDGLRAAGGVYECVCVCGGWWWWCAAAAPRPRGCGGRRMRAGPGEGGRSPLVRPQRERGEKKKKGDKYAPAVRLTRFPGRHGLFCQKRFAFRLVFSVSEVMWESTHTPPPPPPPPAFGSKTLRWKLSQRQFLYFSIFIRESYVR